MKVCLIRMRNEEGLEVMAFALDKKIEVLIGGIQDAAKKTFSLPNAPDALIWHEPFQARHFEFEQYSGDDFLDRLEPDRQWLVAEVDAESFESWKHDDLVEFPDAEDMQLVFGGADSEEFGLQVFVSGDGNTYVASPSINIKELFAAEPVSIEPEEECAPGR